MRLRTAFLGATFLFASATVSAQSSGSSRDEPVEGTQRHSNWGDNPRLELLGLLGLAGLLGLIPGREPSIHIDARGEKAPNDR